jgi:hypothetical protein
MICREKSAWLDFALYVEGEIARQLCITLLENMERVSSKYGTDTL